MLKGKSIKNSAIMRAKVFLKELMTGEGVYEYEEELGWGITKKLKLEYAGYLHSVFFWGFDRDEKKMHMTLFFPTDELLKRAPNEGFLEKVETFCKQELQKSELARYRTYEIDYECDSHENVVRTNGGNYSMYLR